MIADHLDALARGRFASIAAAVGVSRHEVREVLELIRDTLRPYPAFDGNAPVVTSYVVPDLVVRAHDQLAGEFTVELVESALTRLRVRPAPRYRSGPTAAAAESVPPRTLIPPPTKQQTPTPQESRLRRPAGCQEDGWLGGRAQDEDHPVAISNFSAERTRHLPATNTLQMKDLRAGGEAGDGRRQVQGGACRPRIGGFS